MHKSSRSELLLHCPDACIIAVIAVIRVICDGQSATLVPEGMGKRNKLRIMELSMHGKRMSQKPGMSLPCL